MTRTKLFFFVAEDWYFCSHRLALAVSAIEAGFDVAVITRVREHGKIITDAGVRLVPLRMSRRGMSPLREFLTILDLWRAYRAERPDIVHHVAMKPVLYGAMAARLAGCRRVINAIAGLGFIFISHQKKAKVLRQFVKRAFRLLLNYPGSRLVLQNSDDVELFRRNGLVDSDKITLIRGAGVDTRRFCPAPEPTGKPVVMLASRMLWDKGVGDFVEAAALLRKEGVKARFVLVGESDPENFAAIPPDQLRRWQESGVIEWWGHQKEMSHVISQAHLVCLPSYREGLPKVLLEAASCAKPIVATDVPGCREIVRQGETGFLVPARDPVALAIALKCLVNSPELRRRMGDAGRRLVMEEFSQDIVNGQTLRLYREVLQQKV